MKKRSIIFLICTILLLGCENKEEISKNEYIELKNKLLEK